MVIGPSAPALVANPAWTASRGLRGLPPTPARCRHPLGTRETASRSPDCAAALRRVTPISLYCAESRVQPVSLDAVSRLRCVRIPQVGPDSTIRRMPPRARVAKRYSRDECRARRIQGSCDEKTNGAHDRRCLSGAFVRVRTGAFDTASEFFRGETSHSSREYRFARRAGAVRDVRSVRR